MLLNLLNGPPRFWLVFQHSFNQGVHDVIDGGRDFEDPLSDVLEQFVDVFAVERISSLNGE